jgi:hypothetical protein
MTLDELTSWFSQIDKIIFDLNISVNNARRLFENKYQDEDHIKNHGFFRHHYYQLWFILSVQLSKLVSESKNQKFNLFKLLKRLESEKLDQEILDRFEVNKDLSYGHHFKTHQDLLDEIIRLKNKLDSQSETIKKVTTSRDTLYAHRDKDALPQNVTLDDVALLIDLCVEVFNSLRGGIFDIHTDMTRTTDWSIDYVLKECANNRTNKLAKLGKRP